LTILFVLLTFDAFNDDEGYGLTERATFSEANGVTDFNGNAWGCVGSGHGVVA
jgi:hypothetical protein